MKQNYRLTVAYDGTRYYGWEHQPGIDMTVQGKIETVLTRMLSLEQTPEVLGAGRTDAGVHAKAMIANVRLDTALSESQIRDSMNRYLPEDICITDVRIAAERFHSRYNAIGKTYCYTCHTGPLKPVFDRKYCYVLEETPDIDAMKKAARHLIGEHDFAGFCANPRMKKSTVRTVDLIDIVQDGAYLRLTFHGSGFLQHMVRIMTGTLLEVGLGKRSADDMPALINAKNRSLAGFTAPACGLCLIHVDYH